MPIDWTTYDRFGWAASAQRPLDPAARATVEALVADALGLAPADRRRPWGMATRPGRYAATVVRVDPAVGHRWQAEAAAAGIGEIAIKVYKPTADARREARAVARVHQAGVVPLPGLPNAHVQRLLAVTSQPDRTGTERHLAVLAWVAGETLDALLGQAWRHRPPPAGTMRRLLDQLMGRIIIPLWSAGTIWWDVRAANLCWDEPSRRLTLIDPDALVAYYDEIVTQPPTWTRREPGRRVALARLRSLVRRLVGAERRARPGQITGITDAAWAREVEPALGGDGGRDPQGGHTALTAWRRFVGRLDAAGVLS